MAKVLPGDVESLRAALGEACARLRELNNSFNLARLLMNDPELRKESGEWVKENREFLARTTPLVMFKQAALTALDQSHGS